MDIKLHFIEKGSGEPLILLHGNGEDHSYFYHQIEEFSRSYRVIAIDTRGHGSSPRGNAPFSIRQFAKDLDDFMEENDIPSAHIFGFSDGANIAMCFALAYPKRVRRLILNGGNLFMSGLKLNIRLEILREYRKAKKHAAESAKALANYELLGLMVNDPNIKPDELALISAKTLVIAGTHDMIKTSHTRLIASSIPNSRLEFIKGNHFIARNNYSEFNRLILDFLN